MEPTGTCWSLCGIYSVWKPNKTSASRNILEPAGTCSEPVWFWAPGLGQTQLSQIAIPMEPIGTCLNLRGTYSLRGPNSTSASRNLLEPARNIYTVLGTWSQPNTTCRKCNSQGTFWNLLELLRNLQPAWAKLDFSFSEPTGICSAPMRF